MSSFVYTCDILPDVFERCSVHDTEAEQEYVRLHIGQWSESVVILLTSCVAQVELHRMVAWIRAKCIALIGNDKFAHLLNHNVGGSCVQNCWNVFRDKLFLDVGKEEASLTHTTIPNNNQFNSFSVTHCSIIWGKWQLAFWVFIKFIFLNVVLIKRTIYKSDI